MEKVDVRGLSCPMPVIKVKKLIDKGSNEITVTGTSQVSKENVSKLAVSNGYKLNITLDGKDEWEIELTK
ncbi:MAG TPA: sulfurtransferase TusA family protein [Syntrophomonadaceae bacterium]|nr:sulfurtransferase TusA family protein [Syntrophomonadaceae bacterium]HNX28562.1 sulfurtransferase TusA family protein [Syntrophomonadaceae bacterium]HPR92636.1 sulfurtransferase TusA family protein [Syntrophomonadaceae bacterium]